MLAVPQKLDRFELVRLLGRGGMGTVYLARDSKLGREVALKVLTAGDVPAADQRARFLREAHAAAAIRHPNVATIYEAAETSDGTPFLAMEYCEGETLSQRIRRGNIDTTSFLSIARQLTAGLAAAHRRGVIHRDLKSANVMVADDGLVKILDFGLAKLLPLESRSPGAAPHSYESTTGHFFGTLHYLAPEQARGLPADGRSDLFSLGVILYEMATGRLPFDAEGPLAVVEKIRDSEPAAFVSRDPSLPPEVVRIIANLLQKNPDDRYQAAEEVLVDLDAAGPLKGGTRPMGRSLIGKTFRTRRPRRMRSIIALGATAVIVLAAALFWRSSASRITAGSTSTTPIRSMAVLPLENVSLRAGDDFLSVAMADALVTKLQQIPSLHIRPTSAVLEFRGQKPDAMKAASKLDVEGVLEGHYLSSGDVMRVTLQLTDSRTGYAVWSDSVDGNRQNLLKLMDDVSARTLTALNRRVGMQAVSGRSIARSSNAGAYEEYLKARAVNGSLLPAEHANELASLRKAIELDPGFAAAYADLAIALSVGRARGLNDSPDAIAMAEQYARHAVRLDPNLPQAHLAMGRVFVRFPDRFSESVRENLAALRLNPSEPQALHVLTTYFISTGDLARARCVGERLVSVDPGSNDAKTRGYWDINGLNPTGALASSRYALESRDTELAGHDIRASAFLLEGDLQNAEAEQARVSQLVPDHYLGKSLKAMIAAARGDRDSMERAIATFEKEAQRTHWAALRIALCHARLGDRDQAIEWLQRAAALGNHSWYTLQHHPWLEPIRTDPRFTAISAKIKHDLDDVHDDISGVYGLICPRSPSS